MSESPIELRGKGGGVVFQGTQSPGGGSPPVEEEDVLSLNAAVPPLTPTALVWTTNGGATLLDYSDPAAPTVIEAGTYAVTALAAGPVSALGGSAQLNLHVGGSVESRTMAPAPAGGLSVVVGCTAIAAGLAAGDSLTATLTAVIAETGEWAFEAFVVKLA